jgi:hypothetical protein
MKSGLDLSGAHVMLDADLSDERLRRCGQTCRGAENRMSVLSKESRDPHKT